MSTDTAKDKSVQFLIDFPYGSSIRPMALCEAAKLMAKRYDLTYSEALETLRVTTEYNHYDNKFECAPDGPTVEEEMLAVVKAAVRTLGDVTQILSQVAHDASDSAKAACAGLSALPGSVSGVTDKIETLGWRLQDVGDAIKEINRPSSTEG